MIAVNIQPYIALMRLNRPIGIYLLLWPTLIALWLASNGPPTLRLLIIFSCGVIIMRSCGCVINDYADRNFDAQVTRTKNRPLANNQITTSQALALFLILLIMAFILALQLDPRVIVLSTVAASLAVLYPFSKRFTNYPQIILGLAFAWSIPMVYMQIQKIVPLEAWLIFASTMCWVIAYDTIYAMADKADDLKVGIKSTAIAFGKFDKIIIFMLHCVSILGFAYIGYTRQFGFVYYFGLVCALIMAVYQQGLIRRRDPNQCFRAFLNNNYFGALIFLGTVGSFY